jgi:hypothetical protein
MGSITDVSFGYLPPLNMTLMSPLSISLLVLFRSAMTQSHTFAMLRISVNYPVLYLMCHSCHPLGILKP